MAKSARMLQWLVIALFLLLGTGGYFWYQTKAGATVNKSPIPSELSANGLVGYWTFDGPKVDSVNGFVYDSSTSGNTGSFTVSAIAPVTGKIGQAIHMNGTAWEAISLSTATNLEMGTGDMTISSWINITNAINNVFIVTKSGSVSSEGYNMWYDSDLNAMTVSVGTGAASTSYGYDLPLSLIGSGWHLVTCVIDRDMGVLFYLDGAFLGRDGSSVYNGTDITSVSEPVILGYTDANADVVSYDDIRVYNRVLSASEVYQLYTAGNATVNAPPESPLSQSLRGYWKLDDGSGTNATDASGNGNTLAMTGSPSWVAGQIGPYSLDFSGTGQYLSVADPSSGVLDIGDSTDFSITGWFNRDTAAADHTIVAKKNDQTTNAGYVVWIDNNGSTDYLSAEISDGTDTYSAIGTTDLSSTGWHQFSIVWDDSNGLYIYLDGKLDGSTTSSTASINSLANALAFRIGAESDAGVPFDGKLDDIRIYGYALSVDQVKKIYNTTSPTQPVDTSLVGHWTFDGPDIQGTTAIDRSSFGNNGTITGTTKTIGKLGQALSFDGSGDYVETTATIPASGAFTISAWINYDLNYSQDRPSITNFSDGAFYLDDYDSYRLKLTNDNYTSKATSSSGLSVNQWYFVAVVNNSNDTATIYINGIQDGVANQNAGTRTAGNSVTVGARYDGNKPFSGKIDDVRFYARGLTSTEILNLYNMGK